LLRRYRLQIHIVERHEDARHEIWYTTAEYDLMKLEIKKDVLKIRQEMLPLPVREMMLHPKKTAAIGSAFICSHQLVLTR
jgi:hypothetical protein